MRAFHMALTIFILVIGRCSEFIRNFPVEHEDASSLVWAFQGKRESGSCHQPASRPGRSRVVKALVGGWDWVVIRGEVSASEIWLKLHSLTSWRSSLLVRDTDCWWVCYCFQVLWVGEILCKWWLCWRQEVVLKAAIFRAVQLYYLHVKEHICLLWEHCRIQGHFHLKPTVEPLSLFGSGNTEAWSSAVTGKPNDS